MLPSTEKYAKDRIKAAQLRERDKKQQIVNNNTDTKVKKDTVNADDDDFTRNFSKLLRNPELLNSVTEPVTHNMPKVYFFLIPFMALLLKLLFIRRLDLFFVDHIIFVLHFHAFYFSMSAIATLLTAFPALAVIVSVILDIVFAVYFIAALKNVYKVSGIRAFFYSTFVGICYGAVYVVIVLGYAYYILNSL